MALLGVVTQGEVLGALADMICHETYPPKMVGVRQRYGRCTLDNVRMLE